MPGYLLYNLHLDNCFTPVTEFPLAKSQHDSGNIHISYTRAIKELLLLMKPQNYVELSKSKNSYIIRCTKQQQ